ncbi:uncharacterized protein DSM5745_06711 [Aspergillus mulundensis]|uniref:Protein stu1 n=1 Tax=Aspergillus mulundensis TaxID=1810919 RepID=A0A3D8RRN8_9EURO|nr:Protein stu1 [Aspergillus mulundensis]RDW76719.1 Protein stu1 [Aspergillus mulundensis]
MYQANPQLAVTVFLILILIALQDVWVFLFNLSFLVARYGVYFIVSFYLLAFALHLLKPIVARMDQKVRDILEALKDSKLSVDAKATRLLALKSDIKQKNVSEKAVPLIFECLRHAIASPFHALYSAGFSTLGHFMKRMYIQGLHRLVAAYSERLLATLMDRMGDNKDRIRYQTTHALADMWEGAGPQIESLVIGIGLQGKNPYQKLSCLNLISLTLTHADVTVQKAENAAMHADLMAKGYTPHIIGCVEDADPSVRQNARQLLVQMFSGERDDIKHELKLALEEHKVRQSYAREILAGIGLDPDHYDENQSSRPFSMQPRAPSRAATASRAASRAGMRAPSRAAVSRAASRAEISRAPSRADTLVERSGTAVAHRDATPADDDAPVLYHPQPVRTSPVTSDMITATDHETVFAESITATDYHTEESVKGKLAPLLQLHGLPESDNRLGKPVTVRPTPKPVNTTKANAKKASSVDRQVVPATPGRAPKQSGRDAEPLDVQPYDLGSAQDLERLQLTMAPFFEGKETEMNFSRREEYTILIRRITHGNAPQKWPKFYFGFVKETLTFIFITAHSGRTTLQTAGLRTVQSLARVNKTKLDPLIHIILQNVLKLASNAKGITSQNSNMTIIAILENVTCNQRVLGYILSAAKEKNQSLRIYSANWLGIIIDGQSRHKTHSEGVTQIASCIQGGIEDSKEDIRKAYRHTFVRFSGVFPMQAKKVLNALPPKTQQLIEKDMSQNTKDDSGALSDPFVSTTAATTAATTPARAPAKRPVPKKPVSTLSAAPMRPKPPRPATAAGFQKKENESPRKHQCRIPGPGPELSTPLTRRRQKSDPLQDASPAKSKWVAPVPAIGNADNDDRPFGTLVVPRKRPSTSEGQQAEKVEKADMAGHVTESSADAHRVMASWGRLAHEKEFTNQNVVDVKPRKVSISEEIIASAPWPKPEAKERLSRTPSPERDYVDSTAVSKTPLPKRNVTLWSQNATNAHEILLKGIERIQARTMATDGFRKLQGLIQYHPKLFDDEEQFAVLLIGLLDELAAQAPPSKTVLSFGTVADHKTQVLYTVKCMFENFRQFFAPYYPRTVTALLDAERSADTGGHLVKAIENFIDDVVEASKAQYGIIDGVVTHLLPIVRSEAGATEHRMLRKSLDVITQGLASMNEQLKELPSDQMERLGEFVRSVMTLPAVAVKRRIFALCITLREMVDDERFWEIVGSKNKGVDGLLFYYQTKQAAQ